MAISVIPFNGVQISSEEWRQHELAMNGDRVSDISDFPLTKTTTGIDIGQGTASVGGSTFNSNSTATITIPTATTDKTYFVCATVDNVAKTGAVTLKEVVSKDVNAIYDLELWEIFVPANITNFTNAGVLTTIKNRTLNYNKPTLVSLTLNVASQIKTITFDTPIPVEKFKNIKMRSRCYANGNNGNGVSKSPMFIYYNEESLKSTNTISGLFDDLTNILFNTSYNQNSAPFQIGQFGTIYCTNDISYESVTKSVTCSVLQYVNEGSNEAGNKDYLKSCENFNRWFVEGTKEITSMQLYLSSNSGSPEVELEIEIPFDIGYTVTTSELRKTREKK